MASINPAVVQWLQSNQPDAVGVYKFALSFNPPQAAQIEQNALSAIAQANQPVVPPIVIPTPYVSPSPYGIPSPPIINTPTQGLQFAGGYVPTNPQTPPASTNNTTLLIAAAAAVALILLIKK